MTDFPGPSEHSQIDPPSPISSASSINSTQSDSRSSLQVSTSSSFKTITPASHSVPNFHTSSRDSFPSSLLYYPNHSVPQDSRSHVVNSMYSLYQSSLLHIMAQKVIPTICCSLRNVPNAIYRGIMPATIRQKHIALEPYLFPEYPLPWSVAIKKNLSPTSGDINAFFAVMLDNVANLATIGVLLGSFGFPVHFIYQHMFPGTTLAVMLGCFALAFMAIRLDRHNRELEGRDGEPFLITAIPLGLDAPSTIGLPLIVIGPAYRNALATKSEEDAAMEAWGLACATVVMIGILKFVLAIFGERVQHLFHAAGKQGALAAIGLSLLGFNQLTAVLEDPAPGLVSLWFLLLVVISRYDEYSRPQPHKLPYRVSGVLVAAIIGCIIHYSMAAAKISIIPMPPNPIKGYEAAWYPRPANFYGNMLEALKTYGSIAIPYAILVNIGGMSVVAAAKAEGNDYNVAAIQILDAVCTLIGGLFGAVTQTSPYIGHSVYHKTFRCRSLYTVANGFFIGLGGILGYISLISEVLPKSATFPIFIFVAFEIVHSTFHDETKVIQPHHTPALIFAIFPAIAQLMQIVLSQLYPPAMLLEAARNPDILENPPYNLDSSTVSTIGVIVILAHGFIATSLLWGSALAYVIDKKLNNATWMLLLCAVFTFFGVIHSVDPNGSVYLPWKAQSPLPYHWMGGYVAMALITFVSRWFIKPDETYGY